MSHSSVREQETGTAITSQTRGHSCSSCSVLSWGQHHSCPEDRLLSSPPPQLPLLDLSTFSSRLQGYDQSQVSGKPCDFLALEASHPSPHSFAVPHSQMILVLSSFLLYKQPAVSHGCQSAGSHVSFLCLNILEGLSLFFVPFEKLFSTLLTTLRQTWEHFCKPKRV